MLHTYTNRRFPQPSFVGKRGDCYTRKPVAVCVCWKQLELFQLGRSITQNRQMDDKKRDSELRDEDAHVLYLTSLIRYAFK